MDLLDATKKAIQDNDYNLCHVAFIGSIYSSHQCCWNSFIKLAEGVNHIDLEDFVIIMVDKGQFERRHGRWEYRPPCSKRKEIKTLRGIRLEDYN